MCLVYSEATASKVSFSSRTEKPIDDISTDFSDCQLLRQSSDSNVKATRDVFHLILVRLATNFTNMYTLLLDIHRPTNNIYVADGVTNFTFDVTHKTLLWAVKLENIKNQLW